MVGSLAKTHGMKPIGWVNGYTLSFHLGIPMALGLVFGFSQSGSEPLQGVTGHLTYWLFSTIVSWQLLALGSKFVSVILRPFHLPLIVILIVGFTIGITLWAPVSEFRDAVMGGLVIEGKSLRDNTRISDLSAAIGNWLLGISLWLSANYFFLYVLGIPRYGCQPESARIQRFRAWLLSRGTGFDDQAWDLNKLPALDESSGAKQPRLLERLKAGQAAEVLAMVAEDHYTRVLMGDREELIYLRFSDAVQEMDGYPGLQVHRSYWVSLNAVVSFSEKGHRASLKLSNGHEIPVSRSFRQSVRQILVPKLARP